MTVVLIEKWWKRKDHRRIKGARGARFASLGFHAAVISGVLLFVEWVFRSTDEAPYHIADPPAPPPPPLRKSLSYTVTAEMPHLKLLEMERDLPSHVPPRENLNFSGIRNTGKMV